MLAGLSDEVEASGLETKRKTGTGGAVVSGDLTASGANTDDLLQMERGTPAQRQRFVDEYTYRQVDALLYLYQQSELTRLKDEKTMCDVHLAKCQELLQLQKNKMGLHATAAQN